MIRRNCVKCHSQIILTNNEYDEYIANKGKCHKCFSEEIARENNWVKSIHEENQKFRNDSSREVFPCKICGNNFWFFPDTKHICSECKSKINKEDN